jgi:hypothetical protein
MNVVYGDGHATGQPKGSLIENNIFPDGWRSLP